MTGEEKKFANLWLKKSADHDMVRSSRMVVKRSGSFRWRATRVAGQSLPISLWFEDPVVTLDLNHGIKIRNDMTVYEYGYLENGKLFTEEKVVKFNGDICIKKYLRQHGQPI